MSLRMDALASRSRSRSSSRASGKMKVLTSTRSRRVRFPYSSDYVYMHNVRKRGWIVVAGVVACDDANVPLGLMQL